MPTVADVETIAKTLGSILAGKPQHYGALTVIPILAPMQTEPEWLTLAEAGDGVRITELDEEGSVPKLRVANLRDLPLLLLDGEQLVGAKQNRILNMTVLVAAHTEVIIPVSCVERGRRGLRCRHPRSQARSSSECRMSSDTPLPTGSFTGGFRGGSFSANDKRSNEKICVTNAVCLSTMPLPIPRARASWRSIVESGAPASESPRWSSWKHERPSSGWSVTKITYSSGQSSPMLDRSSAPR